NDDVTVASFSAPLPISIDGGLGDDSFIPVNGNFNLMHAHVTIDDVGGNDSLTIDDSASSVGSAYSFGGDTCLRAGQTTVNYSHVETAALYGSTGPDIFNVIPSGTVALQIYGGNPLPPALPGDQINLAMTGVTGAVFNAGGSAG